MRKRRDPSPEFDFAGPAVPELEAPAIDPLRPPAPAVPKEPVSAVTCLRPREPEIPPPQGPRSRSRAVFFRSSYPDPAELDRVVQAAQAAIRAERPGGGKPWVDRSNPVLVRVGRLGPSTSS